MEDTSDTKPGSPYHAMLGGYQGVFLTAAIVRSSLRNSMRVGLQVTVDVFPAHTRRNADLRRGDLQAARARYASGYPELLNATDPRVSSANRQLAIDLALVFQRMGDVSSATALLNASELAARSIALLGFQGHGVSDARIHALRGDKVKALAALREAERAGWRGPAWRYYRDFDPNLASIRNEPEFKAVFSDIERDMARQRAALAARPKDAPLELTDAST